MRNFGNDYESGFRTRSRGQRGPTPRVFPWLMAAVSAPQGMVAGECLPYATDI